MDKVITAVAVTAAALALLSARASAQSCLGLPTRDGDVAVNAVVDLGEGDPVYGGEFAADVSGPTAFRFGYSSVGDGDARTFSALASYDFFLVEPSVCAVGGIVYVSEPGPGIQHRYGIPLGIGIGKTLAMRGYSATVYALPQYLWVREAFSDAFGHDRTGTSNEFQAEAGATLAVFPFYVGGAIVVSTVADSDPAFRVRVGIAF